MPEGQSRAIWEATDIVSASPKPALRRREPDRFFVAVFMPPILDP